MAHRNLTIIYAQYAPLIDTAIAKLLPLNTTFSMQLFYLLFFYFKAIFQKQIETIQKFYI